MNNRTTPILIGLTFASLVFAQRPAGPPDPAKFVQHRVDFLTRRLSLTAAQQEQATSIFTSAATTESALRGSLRTAHQSLSDAVQKSDTATIDQVSVNIGNLTSQLTSTEAKANAAFYQVLTPDQQTTFSQLNTRGWFGPGRGPGGRAGH